VLQITSPVTGSIVERSNGNPFLLRELFFAYAHYAKRDGISDEQWLATDSHSSMRRRFSLLPIQAENVLQYLAVAGQPMGFHQLQMVSRILPDELQRTLNLLATQGWVHTRRNEPESDIEIAHDKFRRAILASLPAERLQRRHFRIARMLSAEVPPPWSRMADHYWQAEQFREAAACYLQAARRAIDTGSFVEALFFLSRAAHKQADRRPSESEEVAMLEGDCLAAVGNSRKAASLFQQLHEAAPAGDSKLLYSCLAGEQWIRAGQLDSGLSLLEKAFDRLQISPLKRSPLSQWLLRWKILVHQQLDSPRRPLCGGQPFGALERSLNRLGIPLTFLDNQLGPDMILQFKKLSRRHGSAAERAIAALHYAVLLSFGRRRQWLRPALGWLHAGQRLVRESNSTAARGTLHFSMFALRVQQGKIGRANQHAQRGIEYYSMDARSRRWELQFLHWGLLGIYWSSLQWKGLRQACLEHRQSAAQRSDSMSQYFMHVAPGHWSDLVVDDVAGARRSLEIAANAISNQSFQSPRFFLWLSQIQQELYEGNYHQATAILERDWAQLKRAYVFGTNHYRWLALCLKMCCFLARLRAPAAIQHPAWTHALEPAGPTRWEHDQFNQRRLAAARRTVREMLQLEHPPLVAHGQAFQLVVQATAGQIAPRSRWESISDRLDRYGHHTYANALRWHQGLWCIPGEGMAEEAEASFLEQGCVAPRRIMDILIPLPHSAAD
jgi:tetratricopeptide (TPR) repeat protein